MPMPRLAPETNSSRLLPPGPLEPPETEPYRAYLNFGGLMLTVNAPCGCQAHYDCSEWSSRHVVESCETLDCDFESDLALEAATRLIAGGPLEPQDL